MRAKEEPRNKMDELQQEIMALGAICRVLFTKTKDSTCLTKN